MKIIAGSYYNPMQNCQNSHRYGLKLNPQLRYDTVCFRSRDLLDLPENDIYKIVKESLKPINFIGHGTEAEVYRIKDTNYCIRVPHVALEVQNFKLTKELTPADKVNHVAAKLGYGISIIKYIEGETPNEHRDNKLYRNKFQGKIADLPVKSYSELLHQIANAIDNEMFLDFSGGNLIVDTAKQKLTAIDFYGVTDNPRPINPLTEMYSVLTCYGSEVETGKKIFDNIVSAGLNEFRPNEIPCMDLALFDFEALCFKRCHDCYTENHEKLINEISRQLKILKDIKKTEIIDKTKGVSVEQNISKIKNLLLKIH